MVDSSNAMPEPPLEPAPEWLLNWHTVMAFADPELVRRFKEIEHNRPQIKGRKIVWTSPTRYQEVDPHPEWTEEKRQAEQAVQEDFYSRLDAGEIEVVGVPIYSPDGQDQVIPARRVRALRKRRGVIYFCPDGRWREGCPGWIDVRVRRIIRAAPAAVDATPPISDEIPTIPPPAGVNDAPQAGAHPYRTGMPGRPTSWNFAERECRRRWAAGERYPTTAAWADLLSKWLMETHPVAPPLSVKALRNHLARLLSELRAGTVTRPE
jgi:hypothetical protein